MHSNAVRDFGGGLRSVDGHEDLTSLNPKPLSVEPTSDGQAAVATFLVQVIQLDKLYPTLALSRNTIVTDKKQYVNT